MCVYIYIYMCIYILLVLSLWRTLTQLSNMKLHEFHSIEGHHLLM